MDSRKEDRGYRRRKENGKREYGLRKGGREKGRLRQGEGERLG